VFHCVDGGVVVFHRGDREHWRQLDRESDPRSASTLAFAAAGGIILGRRLQGGGECDEFAGEFQGLEALPCGQLRLSAARYNRMYQAKYDELRVARRQNEFISTVHADIEARAELEPLRCRCAVCHHFSAEFTEDLLLAMVWQQAVSFEHDGTEECSLDLKMDIFVPEVVQESLSAILNRVVERQHGIKFLQETPEYYTSMNVYLQRYVYNRDCRCVALVQHMLAVLREDTERRRRASAASAPKRARQRSPSPSY
jgi:hypothetical protein